MLLTLAQLSARPAGYHPAEMLVVGALLLVAGVWALWPRVGLLARRRRFHRADDRVLAEDALKCLCKLDLDRQPASLSEIAGTLEIPLNRAAEVIADLEERRLLVSREGRLELTPEGRRYGMNIIRAHRLWERHLADQTGVDQKEWHDQAERQEHRLTPEETDALAASLGYPTYDPHGDPIPTPEGQVAPTGGCSLDAVEAPGTVRITHLEDEPEAVFAQLLAEGLFVGQVLHVTERSPTRISFQADGVDHRLAPVVAANLTVRPLAAKVEETGAGPTLDTLQPGESGVIRKISPQCRGPERQRLLDLGLLPGTRIRAELRSPSGDPTAYRVRDTLIALRRPQARLIYLEPPARAA